DPALVAKFDDATAKLDREDADGAARGFEDVLAGAPKFSPALRRLCYVEMRRNHADVAIAKCREAVKVDANAENEAALALALLQDPKVTDAQTREAMEHARRAAVLGPRDEFAQAAVCEAAMRLSNQEELRGCSDVLLSIAPEAPPSHVYAALSKGFGGDLDGGERELDRAHALGLPDAEYKKLHDAFESARPWPVKVFHALVPVLATWLGAMLLLFVAGLALSKLTLRSVRTPRAGGADASAGERMLRRAYRAVITLGAVYFYVSIPIVALLVVAFAGGLVLLAFMVGHVPIKLLLIVCVVALYTLVAIARSLMTRIKEEEPGERLDLAGEPKLRALLEETARSVHTRPVDTVYLVPNAALAVTERGGFFASMRGRAERALILGVGALDGFEVRPFKAVLAHEYGHFQNEDTAGGGFALAARRALRLMALHMAVRGVATWYNPAWWFVRLYWAIYLRISQGASRLQEVLADRWAVLSYGSESFIKGLRHVVARAIAFDSHANVAIREVVASKAALTNLYQHTVTEPVAQSEIAKATDEAWNRAPSAY
ncbi:MAG TPA: M48 family metalloprotease, partial [Polyangiaceae bacterium]